MMVFMLIVLVAVLILVVVALSYKHKAQQAEHYAALQKTISEAAQGQVQHRTQLDQSLTALETRQRQETIRDTNPQHLAVRTDLDNDWSDDTGLHGNAAATADDHYSAAAAGSTGFTGD